MLEIDEVALTTISDIIAESLNLDVDDCLEMPIHELAACSSDDVVHKLRAHVQAQADRVEVTLDDSDSEPELAESGQPPKSTQKKRAVGNAKAKTSSKKLASSKTKGEAPEMPTITKLYTTLHSATRDNIHVLAGCGAWETRSVVVRNSSSSSGPVEADEKIGELSIVSDAPNLSVKMSCMVHKQCTCWINTGPDERRPDLSHAVQESLLDWMRTARQLDSASHALHSKLIKESFGMKPRN